MKYYDTLGFGDTEETSPGVWEEVIWERKYPGEVIRNTRRWSRGENMNDDFEISNEISIVADPYLRNNFHLLRYINWQGAKWKITNVSIQPPRLVLTIGGVYNGDSGPAVETS